MLRTLIGRGIRVARLYPHLPKTTHNTLLTAHSRAKPILLQARMASSSSDDQASGSMEAGNNRLAQEKSPYLLQHASNPVDWYPWGQEAFDKARVENKLIFLSVGYSTCHWCHVMERESFENVDIGKLMNEHYVSIKVDREERPDVDRVYMTFIQATAGGGGWPMSVWLTPDLKPLMGGTYFPPHDRFGRPGFPTILQSIARQWGGNREALEQQSTKIIEALQAAVKVKSTSDPSPLGTEVMEKCFKQLTDSFDNQYGGFGGAPKFPQPVNFNFLFRLYSSPPGESEIGERGLKMCLHTLKMMAKGGIHDHVSQGFHRYSTDRFWHVPHFEKMLYDQGQLAVAYLDAYQITKDAVFADVARDILEYVGRDLSDKAGGFYSAEDADSLPAADETHKKEGAFCVWTDMEVRTHLSDTVEGSDLVTLADVFCKHYDIKTGGNVDFEQDPHGELKDQNVLIARGDVASTASMLGLTEGTVEAALETARRTLHKVRLERPRPHLDDKMLTAWNGLMISGFSRAGQVLQAPEFTKRAEQAVTFIRQHLYDPSTGCLLRSAYRNKEGDIAQIPIPIQGFVDDYCFLIRGLLDLYEANYDEQWIEWASQLQEKLDELLWDTENGGYFSTTDKDSSILLRLKEDQDGAEPSANSVACMNLLRLSHYLNRPDYQEKASKLFSVFGERLQKIPIALPEMASALLFQESTAKQIIICGDPQAEDTRQLLQCVHTHYLPNKVLILTDEGQTSSFLSSRLDILKTLQRIDGKATAYVCENYQCQLPVNSVDDLADLLKK
ncbi:spermatogenesis-associated protein 20-like [Strongylocentrotus purpuratus]|uniref:Spermatogenesis-associated protein 20-like TRX domain-containing protein n=1 Tax=Strongylocentrotus purpuratus TaxID=7668 RepID=A0A7M7NRF4_STRPU|nr:spermatogenesis-associated protein 20-like [Strongylocentrotus purpuratus]